MEQSGALTVSDSDYYKAKMLLAQAGLPKSAPDGDSVIASLPMGASRAVEGERLRDARETDLARTIEQIVEAINGCDLGIIPNHRNIFTEINTPTRIFEYLALGKPVIAPRAQGIRDYFGDGDLIFFELGDSQDLARQIEFAYHHRVELDEIVRRGQAVYRAHMWSREKAVLLNAMSELV